jgi:hypothetical protein
MDLTRAQGRQHCRLLQAVSRNTADCCWELHTEGNRDLTRVQNRQHSRLLTAASRNLTRAQNRQHCRLLTAASRDLTRARQHCRLLTAASRDLTRARQHCRLLIAASRDNRQHCRLLKAASFLLPVTLLNDCYQCIMISYKMHTRFFCFYFNFCKGKSVKLIYSLKWWFVALYSCPHMWFFLLEFVSSGFHTLVLCVYDLHCKHQIQLNVLPFNLHVILFYSSIDYPSKHTYISC